MHQARFNGQLFRMLRGQHCATISFHCSAVQRGWTVERLLVRGDEEDDDDEEE